jgi:AraC family transcriptional regulator
VSYNQLMDYIKNITNTLEYIEDHLTSEVTFKDLEHSACLSLFHFCRVFHAVTGDTPGNYLKLRRLTVSSGDLINTDDRIIDIALKYQFGSQEAFTRAFKLQFGLTPAKYRVNAKPLVMLEKKPLTKAALSYFLNSKFIMEPKIVTLDELTVVGMVTKTTMKNNVIPALWKKFNLAKEQIRNVVKDSPGYGICLYDPTYHTTDFTIESEYEYLAALAVTKLTEIPEGMISRIIPKQKYAVFTHKGALDTLQHTYDFIYGTWELKSGYKVAKADDFEVYDQRFDPAGTPESEMDIYVPIE